MNKKDLIQSAKEWIAYQSTTGGLTTIRMYQYQRDLMDCISDFGIIRIMQSNRKLIILIPKKKYRLQEPETYEFSKHELSDEEYDELKSMYWGSYLDHDPQAHKEAGFAYLNTNPLLLDINKNPAPNKFLIWVSRNSLFSIILLNILGSFLVLANMDFFKVSYTNWSNWVIAIVFTLTSCLIALSGNE